MKLTNHEQQEINYLRELQQSVRPMMQDKFDRLKYLNKKEFHNCCSNPSCTGYEGVDSETKCLECNSNLFKQTIT